MPMVPRRPWHQVVPNYSQRQDVLHIKKVALSCLASSRSHQDVTYPEYHYHRLEMA